jgi:hypothetical protein
MDTHEKGRALLIIIGFVLIVIGIPLVIAGFSSFFQLQSNFFSLSFEESSALSAQAFASIVPGMFLTIIGAGVLRFGFIGRVSKYIADETGPAISSVSESITKGVKKGGGIDITVHSDSNIRIKCRNCGTLNDEDATYCDNCGSPL